MAQRWHHYESAFEEYLRARRVPYVAVDEARRALLPEGATLAVESAGERAALKSFDFVIYATEPNALNLLIELKGRKLSRPASTKAGARLETWVTEEDLTSLRRWEALFGPGFEAVVVFVYWCDQTPADGLFHEVFEHRGRWYTVRAVRLVDYTRHMKVRSPRWGTVHLSPSVFENLSRPLIGA